MNKINHEAPKRFGSEIKNIRISLEMTQAELSSRTGISAPVLCRIEKGVKSKYSITGYHIRIIEEALGVPEGTLYREFCQDL